jgi:N-dimethylarginine dimethylaminohydrolase
MTEERDPEYRGIDNDRSVLRGKGFDFVDVGFAEAKDLGVNLMSVGNRRVLSMAGSHKLNQDMRDRGYEVYAPDMSMFTLSGGGVHCLCQALKRDSVEV